MKKNNIINMTYPDGTIHQVEMREYYPIRLGDRFCYIARYFDHTLNSDMITLLTNCNGLWCKIPLNDDGYYYLSEYVERHGNLRLDAEEYASLGDIALGMPMTLIPPRKNKNGKMTKPQLWLSYYVPINTKGATNVKDNIFGAGGCLIENTGAYDSPVHYDYHKIPNIDIVDKHLTTGVTKCRPNSHLVKEYDFEVDIPDGTYARKKVTLPDGKRVVLLYIAIPGHWNCQAFYSDFVRQDDYKAARDADRINIHTTADQYEDVHDIDRVWRDGGNKKLDMTFDDELRSYLAL